MKEIKKSFFGKEETLMLQGIAILLMIWHHLFCFPSWLSDGVCWLPALGEVGRCSTAALAFFGSICVQVFALISGYALFANPKAYGTWKSRGIRLFTFLGAYWLVCGFFLIVALLNHDNLPSSGELMLNLIGRECGPYQPWINVPFAWYVTFYIEFIVLVPLLIWIFKGNVWRDCIALVGLVGIMYVIRLNLPNNEIISGFAVSLMPIICVGIGILAAKYDFFRWFHDRIGKRIPAVAYLLIIIGLVGFKYSLAALNPRGGVNWSFFVYLLISGIAWVLVICCLELISKLKSVKVKRLLTFFGTLSLFLWFLHGIFFTGKNFIQVELYAIKEPILIYIVCLVVITPVAFLFHKGYGLLVRLFKR